MYFGGTHLGFYNTNVYMFDIATNTWTQVGAQISQAPRVGMQCAASGDMFVVWGGGKYQKDISSAVGRNERHFYLFTFSMTL